MTYFIACQEKIAHVSANSFAEAIAKFNDQRSVSCKYAMKVWIEDVKIHFAEEYVPPKQFVLPIPPPYFIYKLTFFGGYEYFVTKSPEIKDVIEQADKERTLLEASKVGTYDRIE
jgi:hypothetical protein